MRVRMLGFVLVVLFLSSACGASNETPVNPVPTEAASVVPSTVAETPTAVPAEPGPPVEQTPTAQPAASPPVPSGNVELLAPTSVPARPTPTPTRTPPLRFDTLPPGAQLPTNEECSAWVRRSSFEPRPENERANHFVPPSGIVPIDGASLEFNAKWAARIDGRFTGTTDEIIQWASCKWGFDEDMTRARAVAESTWRQSNQGDRTSSASLCAVIGRNAPCYQSYGLLQVKESIHDGTYPWAEQSTAFNADYSLAWLRACYEGDFTWLKNSYRAGDLNGCVGAWFSGNWKDQGANTYLARVLDHLAKRRWEAPGF